MSLATASLWIVSLWLVIYAIKYSSRRRKSLLPLSQSRRPVIEVTVKYLNLRFKTEVFNVFHGELSTWLSTNKSRISRRILLRLYDFGSFISIVGTLLGFCLLSVTAASLSSELLHTGQDYHHGASTVVKRGLDDPAPSVPPAFHALRISPIIPGLTVPLSHLPLILLALAVSQIAHEAGHAITAALHRIPMLSCGVAVTFLFPSAFVALPAARLEKLHPRDRLQIASGGCFHNIVLFCLLFSAAWLGMGFLPTWILFQDTSTLGKVVVSVDYDSPLASYLPVGDLITKLDDFPMAAVSVDDPWGRYLLSPFSDSMQGWCIDNSLLNDVLAPACVSTSSYSCFVSMADENAQYELDPVHIFTGHLERCYSSVECLPSSSCVVPRRDQQLVRILILGNNADTSTENTIIWKGPKEEIWEQVQVSNLRPRSPLVSPNLLRLSSTFFEYMKITNLSLYLVNTLPITALDGYQSLVALLQFLYGPVGDNPQSIDLEALNTTRSRVGRVQRAWKTFLSFLSLFLIVLCGLLGTINWTMK